MYQDEANSLRDAATFLRGDGSLVDTVETAESTLFEVQTREYDVILLEVIQPESQGWAILKQLRLNDNSTPVLMLTTSTAVQDRVKALDGGADDCLAEPFALSELAARIRALLRRSAGSPQAIIDIGPVSINTISRRVTFRGNGVPLTAKEYSLLALLALHRNELVTRTMIYEHLFDQYDPSLSNLVDVYVSKIRRKIEHSLITTCRGKGYIIKH